MCYENSFHKDFWPDTACEMYQRNTVLRKRLPSYFKKKTKDESRKQQENSKK